MRTKALAAAMLLSAAAHSQQSPPQPDPINLDEARLALMAVRSEARDAALRAISSGDALESLLAIDRYFRVAPRDQTLDTLRSEIEPSAIRTALALAEQSRAKDDPQAAIDLLVRVRSASEDPRLAGALERASLALWLREGAEAEARGESGAARRAYLRAAAIDPHDDGVAAGLARTGASPDPRETVANPDLNIPIQQNRALERDLELTLRRVERLEGEVDALSAQSTLSGHAEPASRELDRRLDDLRREVSRLTSDLSRRLDRLESDVDRIRRDVDRIR